MFRYLFLVLAVAAFVTADQHKSLYESEQELYNEVLPEIGGHGATENSAPSEVLVQSRSASRSTSPTPSSSSRRRVSSSSRRRVSSSSRRRVSSSSRRRVVHSYGSRRRGHVVVHSYSRRRRGGTVYVSGHGGGCFPRDATVESKTRGKVAISDIKVGDEVLTHGGKYSEVLFFAVHKPDVETEHIKITTPTKTLVLTGSHAVFDHMGKAKLAAKIRVGDSLLTAGVVQKIEHQRGTGLIAPVTTSGTLMVEGVATSDYGPMADLWGQNIAHAALVPLRMLRWVLGKDHRIWHSHDEHGRHTFMNYGLGMLSPFFED